MRTVATDEPCGPNLFPLIAAGALDTGDYLLRILPQLSEMHLTLDRDVPAQMIRIGLPAGTDIYPEISGSHYRCSIRFLVWQDAGNRAIQTTEDVRFTLSTCT